MKAVITVIGKDMVGILAKVSVECSQKNVNILQVSQNVLDDLFAMIMLVDITDMNCDFLELSDDMVKIGKDIGLTIHVMHEDIFNSMHRV